MWPEKFFLRLPLALPSPLNQWPLPTCAGGGAGAHPEDKVSRASEEVQWPLGCLDKIHLIPANPERHHEESACARCCCVLPDAVVLAEDSRRPGEAKAHNEATAPDPASPTNGRGRVRGVPEGLPERSAGPGPAEDRVQAEDEQGSGDQVLRAGVGAAEGAERVLCGQQGTAAHHGGLGSRFSPAGGLLLGDEAQEGESPDLPLFAGVMVPQLKQMPWV